MSEFKEITKKNFKVVTAIDSAATYSDGISDSTYKLETNRAIPLLDTIIMMTGVLFIESDPEGLYTITYTDGTKEQFKQAKKSIKEFDNFFSLVSYIQGFRTNTDN